MALRNSVRLRQVEAMVRTKMEHKEYILLCLEDSNDWSNATTRRLVMQVRPDRVLRQRLRAHWRGVCPISGYAHFCRVSA